MLKVTFDLLDVADTLFKTRQTKQMFAEGQSDRNFEHGVEL